VEIRDDVGMTRECATHTGDAIASIVHSHAGVEPDSKTVNKFHENKHTRQTRKKTKHQSRQVSVLEWATL
jgi:hypothetical protein